MAKQGVMALDFMGIATPPASSHHHHLHLQQHEDHERDGGLFVGDPCSQMPGERCLLDKPLEELTEADILQLTREDCRKYLKEKAMGVCFFHLGWFTSVELVSVAAFQHAHTHMCVHCGTLAVDLSCFLHRRSSWVHSIFQMGNLLSGMRRPSWNKFQAIQQVLSLKGLLDSKNPEGKHDQKEDSPPPKDFAHESSDATLDLLKGEADCLHEQGVKGKELYPFFGPGKQSFGMTIPQKAGTISDGQCHPSRFMDDKGPSFLSNSTSLLPNSDLTLSLPSAWEQVTLSSNNGGFGSPLPVFPVSKERMGSPFATLQATPARNGQSRSPLLQGAQPSTDLGARPASASGRPGQLTIFYAGLVKVYDEIPADKAQAIMLLAGSGKQWGTASVMHPLTNEEHPLAATPNMTSATTHPISSSGDVCKDSMSPPVSTVFNSVVANQGVRRPHAELPQARKASLQRFLEKRKERVLSKAPYPSKKSDTEDSSAYLDRACDMSSSISKGFEPVSTSPLHQRQFFLGAPSSWPSRSCGSEDSSPTKVARAENIVLNSDRKGKARREVEKSETVYSADEKMTEAEEDAASSQL